MPEGGLFRKAAIDKVSSPEQLDMLMKVTSPVGWVALTTIATLLSVALLWSFYGSIPDLVSGQGVLLRGERLREITTGMPGSLMEMRVSPGSEVEAGQVIAVISRRGGGIEQRRADEMAITRNQGMISAKRNELASIRRQRTTQEELVKKGLKAGNTLFQYDSRITATRGEINNLQNQTAVLRSRLQSTAEVTSPEAGRVVEVLKSAGDSVAPGQALVRLEAAVGDAEQEFCGGKIHALLYVSARVAGKVRPGQIARISPLDVKREEYGFIVGSVEWMASFAASPDDMGEKLKNRSLVESYSGGGPVFEARVCLELDPENLANGFKWSSSKGPDRVIGTGGQCSASVVVASKKPYTYVIPTVKKTIGI